MEMNHERAARASANKQVFSKAFKGVVMHMSTELLLATCVRARLKKPTIRVVSTQHVARRPKHMDLDVIPRPPLIENAVEFPHKFGTSPIAFFRRQYSIVQLSQVPCEFRLFSIVQEFLRHCLRSFQHVTTLRIRYPSPRKGHTCLKSTAGKRRGLGTCPDRSGLDL